jgi:cell wall-associated NlpC family hydrolase
MRTWAAILGFCAVVAVGAALLTIAGRSLTGSSDAAEEGGATGSKATRVELIKAEKQQPNGPVRIAEETPPKPKHLDVAPTDPEAEAGARGPLGEPAPPDIPVSKMPPASAGSNGSYEPPPSDARRSITPRTMARLVDESEGRDSILLSGIALAPPKAPERIQAVISGANEIVGRPYIWGGGHASWYSRGYDCSGAVSYALAAGGFLQAPLDSSNLELWGEPGPGRWLTVYANPGHAYAVVAGLRWDTVGDASGTGPRWHAEGPYPEGFVARHPAGY